MYLSLQLSLRQHNSWIMIPCNFGVIQKIYRTFYWHKSPESCKICTNSTQLMMTTFNGFILELLTWFKFYPSLKPVQSHFDNKKTNNTDFPPFHCSFWRFVFFKVKSHLSIFQCKYLMRSEHGLQDIEMILLANYRPQV